MTEGWVLRIWIFKWLSGWLFYALSWRTLSLRAGGCVLMWGSVVYPAELRFCCGSAACSHVIFGKHFHSQASASSCENYPGGASGFFPCLCSVTRLKCSRGVCCAQPQSILNKTLVNFLFHRFEPKVDWPSPPSVQYVSLLSVEGAN